MRSGSRSGAPTIPIRPTTWPSRRATSSVCGPAGQRVRPVARGLVAKALVTTALAAAVLYRQSRRCSTRSGPFFPLIQPTQVFVSTKDLKGAVYNAEYDTDITQISPA